MYDDDVDFYSLSPQNQRQLVHNKRVATTDRLLSEIPDGEPPVRVFEKSLENLVLDKLERGRYSTGDLADEFGVRDSDIRRILHKYRRRGADSFTNESFKLNLIVERDAVIRAKETRGSAHYYTLETIPYFARIADPTLTLSLLNIDNRLADFPHLTDVIPAGKASQIDEEYALVIGDFWDIDPQEVFDNITDYDRKYIETTLLPFPIVGETNEYDRVSTRFKQSDGVYTRFRAGHDAVDKVGNNFIDVAERGNPGIRLYQVTSIDLADLKWYAEQEAPELLSQIDDWIDTILQTLDPDQVSETAPSSVEDMSDDTAIAVEEEVLTVLSDDLQTAAEIHEALPSLAQSEITVDDVREALEMLARHGVITKEQTGDTAKYNSDSGTVSWPQPDE